MKKGRKNQNTNYHHMYSLCNKHMNQYVLAQTVDGQNIDGIVTGVDGDYLYLAVPLTDEERKQQEQQQSQTRDTDERQYGYGYAPGGYGGYGAYGGYGYGAPYGYGYAPPNRFRRLILPLAALVAISALPWY
ncbi:hypothetical protein [Pontibacillus sp. HMF3514]|uniref:hypothetical protein n=1 Tax=Pontibacillus sp. HMF3514 TaxID=2692425 RepID=UPI00131FF04E|nr:hypothetical protein [Pontibacillus sp. HMF3514]QHE51442.1 hypothetical protein GS400_05075 [Pontibacillus sp. HMF3514]